MINNKIHNLNSLLNDKCNKLIKEIITQNT